MIAEHDGPAGTDDLPFRLVEAVINRRADDGDCPADYPWTTAEAALRVLGCAKGFARLRAQTADRLEISPG